MVASMSDRHSWLVSVDASNPRDFSEQIKVGTEYRFLGMFRSGRVMHFRPMSKVLV